MISPAIPENEIQRLQDLRALSLLDTPPQERFDNIVNLAQQMFQLPIAYIALVDTDRQWFLAKCGIDANQTGRDVSFCGHTILKNEPMIISDAREDERFKDNPMVTGEPYVRFYAGFPLRGPKGTNVGTLCVVDNEPRELPDDQLVIFESLARLAEQQLGMTNLIDAQQELIDTQAQLVTMQRRLSGELAEAARYIRSQLPEPIQDVVEAEYEFISSSQLGGDLLGYHWIDNDHMAVYLLDVCGHGVGASLMSVSVYNAIRRQALRDTEFRDPGSVLDALNRAFPMEEHNQKFFTMWYACYERGSRTLRYASAGHPPALLIEPDSDEPTYLGSPNFMVGVLEDAEFETHVMPMQTGSRLYLYSDGVTECRNPGGDMLGISGLSKVLMQCNAEESSIPNQLVNRVRDYVGEQGFEDDFSVLQLTFR